MAQVSLHHTETLRAYPTFHLTEMSLAWSPVTVSTHAPQAWVSSEALHQVLHVRDLEKLPEHQGSKIPRRIVFYRFSRSLSVKALPEDGLDRG